MRTLMPIEAAIIVFIGVYALVNLILVAYVEWSLTNRAWSANTDIVVRTAGIGFVMYSLVGLVVGVLLREQLYLGILATLIPVWALRTGLTYRARMDEVYYETIHSLTQMLQRAHPYTHGHLERVSRTAEEVAFRLGLSARRARLVREAAVLHDIGKIAVNESILDKPGKLTSEELVHVRRHAEWGAEILAPVPGFADLVPWIRHHHERPDGTGYPDALPNERIPIESKIIAVVDAYDAMTGDDDSRSRTYRDPMTAEDALLELQRCAGTQFDHAVVEAFRLTVTRGPE
jgi:putative nucleotidyltransferase with HDIG domain